MSQPRHDERARLSEYLDGELEPRSREEVEAHLAECDACRTVLEGLADVRARARTLEDRTPDRDLWPGIRDALDGPRVIDLETRLRTDPRSEPGRPGRRGVFLSLPQLAAAAAALVVLAAGGAWGLARTVAPGPTGVVDARGIDGLPPRFAGYADEVAELQEVLGRGRDRLRTRTVRILEKNLMLIDGAIRESVEALADDPGNPFVEQHLQRSMDRKLTYLREAAALLETTD